MMHTDSEQSEMDIINALLAKNKESGETRREDKATRRETRYEKWKRNKKAKSDWTILCCCFHKSSTETNNVDKMPLVSPII